MSAKTMEESRSNRCSPKDFSSVALLWIFVLEKVIMMQNVLLLTGHAFDSH